MYLPQKVSFNKYLWSICQMPVSILGTEDLAMNKIPCSCWGAGQGGGLEKEIYQRGINGMEIYRERGCGVLWERTSLLLNRMTEEILTEKLAFDQKIWKKWAKEPLGKRKKREEQWQRAQGRSTSVLLKEQWGGWWGRVSGWRERKISQVNESPGLWLFLWKIRFWRKELYD